MGGKSFRGAGMGVRLWEVMMEARWHTHPSSTGTNGLQSKTLQRAEADSIPRGQKASSQARQIGGGKDHSEKFIDIRGVC